MAFTTKVITDTSPDFGDNPQTITESGKPASVEVDNLTPNTAHWTKAEIWQDGVLNDTSNVETFTTLPAGTITLEYIQTTRSGYGYDVTYRYTSTYAPSSAILSTNGTQFQGFINSEQHTVSFWVTGLTAGTAYLTNVTLYDIYAESATVMGSIVATVVNEVRITDTTPAQTSVDCELDYVIDSGFTVGYVEYWLSTQDPATEQAQGHFYFNNGDTSVTAGGLTAGTAYLFRATILLGDGTTEIVSNVVSASTLVDYAGNYFTIKNESGSNNTISIVNSSYANPNPLYWSVDNGTTWNSISFGGGGTTTITTLTAGQSVIFHHTGRMASTTTVSGNTYYYANAFSATENISASGNLFSLSQGTNFPTTQTSWTYQWLGLFQNCAKLISAENIVYGKTGIGEGKFHSMFLGCTSLTRFFDLSTITEVRTFGAANMFDGCTSLTTPPNLSNVTTVDAHGMVRMLRNCTALTTPPNLSRVTTVGEGGMSEMLYGCTALTTPPNLSNVTSTAENSFGAMFRGDTSLRTAPSFRGITAPTKRLFEATFYGCTALAESPDFRGIARMLDIGEKAFNMAFVGCANLEKVYAPSITSWDRNKFSRWLENVSANGTLYKNANLTTIPTNDTSGVPSGWRTEDYA